MKRDSTTLVPEVAVPQASVASIPASQSGTSSDDLHRLIHDMAEGSREAFRQLYERTHRQLLASAMRLVRNQAAAEDVVQETYIRVWRYSRSYKPGSGSPLTWIMQILRNRAIDLHAYGRREEVPLDEESADADADDPDADDDLVGERAPGGTSSSTSPKLAASFAWLSGPYRQVLHLAHHEGLSHAEIAQRLGVPLGTAKTWLRRAVIALRVALDSDPAAAAGRRRPPTLAPTETSK